MTDIQRLCREDTEERADELDAEIAESPRLRKAYKDIYNLTKRLHKALGEKTLKEKEHAKLSITNDMFEVMTNWAEETFLKERIILS